MSAIRHGSAIAALLGAAALSLLSAAPAGAAVACAVDTGAETLTVTMSATGDRATLRVNAGTVEVLPAPAGGCAGGTPTTSNIGDINVVDNSASGNTVVDIREPNQFAPGTEGGTTPEIDFIVALGTGTTDEIEVKGESGADTWRFGNAGLNTNVGVGTADLEVVTFLNEPDSWSLFGNDAADTIDAQGGEGTGAGAYTEAAALLILGGPGEDTLRGGDSATGDQIEGFLGNDTVLGFAGNDLIGGAPGNNLVAGATEPTTPAT